jgi:hypothetical protein
MYNLTIFENFNLLIQQFIQELNKSKKHWQVIKNFYTAIIKYFTNILITYAHNSLKKLKFNFSSLFLFITGRPHGRARTFKIFYKFGNLKQTQFNVRIENFFLPAQTNVGTFGITFRIS